MSRFSRWQDLVLPLIADRQRAGDHGAAAGGDAGCAAGGEYHALGDRAADDDLREDAAGIQRLSVAAAGDDAGPAGAQCRHDAADPHAGGQRQACCAAGGVVKAFGEFVAGDQLVVGIIIFVIIVVIQFVVITKGATRISEVAARFALDGMPGKQMAIDADLNAGIIDEKRGPAPPRGNHAAGRLLRGDGRCQQVRPRRRDRRHHHHDHQHRRRPVIGMVEYGMALGRRGGGLHAS